MSELDVRIVTLEPIRVAMTYGFGPGPEGIAWENMRNLVNQSSLMQDGQPHRFFGFNNPEPSPGSPNYGYEQWVTVGQDFQPEGDVKVKEFGGGMYAVTRCTLDEIMETWHELFTWRERSSYRFGPQQWLEESLTPPLDGPMNEEEIDKQVLDLYMPIA